MNKRNVIDEGRKLIGTKWVFKIKNEPDGSLRYKSRIVTKGYMQIPGVDYTERFSPVAQATSLRVGLSLVLYHQMEDWVCELVDIEAALLEGRLTNKTYIELPQGIDELGFMTNEQYKELCIELLGGMYGNVDAALLYFKRFEEYALQETGLNLTQSESDPCIFYRKNKQGRTQLIIIIYVDDCCLIGKQDTVNKAKKRLREEFGTVENGKLRKLLGVRYDWKTDENTKENYLELSMDNKAGEIVASYEKVTGKTPKNYSSPGAPGSVLTKNQGETVNRDDYRSIIGKLMFYTTKIGPECAFAIGQLARHMQNPGEEHWKAL